MTDIIWVVSSCVLIAAVIAVRAIFGKKMSAGLKYALWGLVLIRLLIPGTIFQSPVSVESAVKDAEVVRDLQAVKDVSAITQTESGAVIGQLRRPAAPVPAQQPASEAGEQTPAQAQAEQQPAANTVSTAVVAQNATPERFERMQKTLELRDILNIIWFTGMGLAALYFIAANLRFYLKLKSRRQKLDIEAGCPVYSVEGLNSSCLFLNSIYISKENAEDKQKLAYVLEHEKAHRRHGDGAFALLRSAALVLHWYNPLVWAAAFLSRRDSELFADAGAIKAVGEDSREDYGRTLIELSSRQSVYAPIACAATMMTSGKRELKSRITNIARNKKMGATVCAIVLVLAFIAVGFSFLGADRAEALTDDTAAKAEPTEEPKPAGELINVEGSLIWSLDIDGDGRQDRFVLDCKTLEEEGKALSQVQLADGTAFDMPALYTSHSGVGTYAVTSIEGRDYILYHQPMWSNGLCEDVYRLYTVENGEIAIARSGSVEFEVSSVRPLGQVDVDEVMAFVDDINDIWQVSRLAFTTDIYTVGRNLYGRSDGERHVLEGMAYFWVPEGKDTESYYYVEELIRLDSEFGLDDTLSAKEKLEAANRIMAENAGNTTAVNDQPLYESIVANADVGTVYINANGSMYAIEGENKDGIFNGAECVAYTMDGGVNASFIKAGSEPCLMDTEVYKACMLFYSANEYKYAGDYGESLVYLKTDGTVWLRGSNPRGIFGGFARAEEPVKLAEGAVYISADMFSVAVGLADGRIIAWDLTVNNGGKPFLVAENADPLCFAGDRAYLTREGELMSSIGNKDNGFEFAGFGKDIARFGRCGSGLWSLGKNGTLTLYAVTAPGEIKELVLAENVVCAYSDPVSSGLCCVTKDGEYTAFDNYGTVIARANNASHGGVQYGYMWYVDSNGGLHISNGSAIAQNVVYAVRGAVRGSCLYETADGRLYSINYCSPEGRDASEPYEIPIPRPSFDAAWLTSEAWAAAEKAMAMYGGKVEREHCCLEADAEYAIVTFYASDVDPMDYAYTDPSLSVYFRNYDDEGDWGIFRVEYYMSFPEDYDWNAYTSDNDALPVEMEFNVTARSVSDAAWEAARSAGLWFTELPEANVFICSDAAPLAIATGENFTETQPQYTVKVGFIPKNYLAFAHRFGEWSTGLCIYEDEHNLYYVVELKVWLIGMNADGTYRMGVGIPEDGPWG